MLWEGLLYIPLLYLGEKVSPRSLLLKLLEFSISKEDLWDAVVEEAADVIDLVGTPVGVLS